MSLVFYHMHHSSLPRTPTYFSKTVTSNEKSKAVVCRKKSLCAWSFFYVMSCYKGPRILGQWHNFHHFGSVHICTVWNKTRKEDHGNLLWQMTEELLSVQGRTVSTDRKPKSGLKLPPTCVQITLPMSSVSSLPVFCLLFVWRSWTRSLL